eukprot:TRINITY_DN8521_c0_g1_i2.p1 TRINITY_DN8521_c0_g1~~TRINITY_DN8521_c0_g1_i2.p1  ORF type:complete len:335 (-),score=51.82 TRINITY_DN8521_c0_g1_i2:144-1148(-)
MALKRIRKEISYDSKEYCSVGILSSDDLFRLRCWMIGPEDTPYAGGIWTFTLALPPAYPFQTPNIEKVEQPLYHESIGASGLCMCLLPCLGARGAHWSPARSIYDVLRHFRLSYCHSEAYSPLRCVCVIDHDIARQRQHQLEQFHTQARLLTQQHACPSHDDLVVIAECLHNRLVSLCVALKGENESGASEDRQELTEANRLALESYGSGSCGPLQVESLPSELHLLRQHVCQMDQLLSRLAAKHVAAHLESYQTALRTLEGIEERTIHRQIQQVNQLTQSMADANPNHFQPAPQPSEQAPPPTKPTNDTPPTQQPTQPSGTPARTSASSCVMQ